MSAFDEYLENEGATEPNGWYRCPTDGRRRPDGDPTKEYISP